jgi:hypothetical protein
MTDNETLANELRDLADLWAHEGAGEGEPNLLYRAADALSTMSRPANEAVGSLLDQLKRARDHAYSSPAARVHGDAISEAMDMICRAREEGKRSAFEGIPMEDLPTAIEHLERWSPQSAYGMSLVAALRILRALAAATKERGENYEKVAPRK